MIGMTSNLYNLNGQKYDKDCEMAESSKCFIKSSYSTIIQSPLFL